MAEPSGSAGAGRAKTQPNTLRQAASDRYSYQVERESTAPPWAVKVALSAPGEGRVKRTASRN